MSRRITVLLLTVAVLGCGGADAPADEAAATTDAEGAAPAARQEDGDGEMPMTRETFTRYLATVEELALTVRDDPAMADALGLNADDTPEQAAEQLRQHPEIVRVLTKHDFSPRQYASYTMRMAGAMFAAGALESGLVDEMPEESNTEDTQFMTENWDWVQQEYARLQEKFPRAAPADEEQYDDEDEG